MREGLLVDAYNLFHSARASSHARHFPDIKRLAYLLEHYASSRGLRAVLVIDGTRLSDEWTDTPVLQILCSRGGEPADAVMEAWMARLAPSERLAWALVSNDVNLGRMGAGMGLRVRSCSALVEELACFAAVRPTHPLDTHRPSRPGLSKPFNNPFDRLAAFILLAVAAVLSAGSAGAAEFGGFSRPESVASDSVSGEIYVSNRTPPSSKDSDPAEAEQVPTPGFISKISGNGVVLIQKFIQGGPEGSGLELREPRGMAVLEGKLWVADGDRLKVYRTDTGVRVGEIRVSADPPAELGAVAAGRRGEVYAADSESSRIFRIETRRQNRVTLWSRIEALKSIVGMVLDPVTGHLFVVTRSSGQLVEMDRRGRTQVVKKGLGVLDGMTMDAAGTFYFSSAERGEVYRVSNRGRGPIALAAVGLRAPTGIGFDAVRGELLVLLGSDSRLTSVPVHQPAKNLIPGNFFKKRR